MVNKQGKIEGLPASTYPEQQCSGSGGGTLEQTQPPTTLQVPESGLVDIQTLGPLIGPIPTDKVLTGEYRPAYPGTYWDEYTQSYRFLPGYYNSFVRPEEQN